MDQEGHPRHAGDVSLKDVRSAAAGRFLQELTPSPGWSFAHSGLTNADALARLLVESDEWLDDPSGNRMRRLRLRDHEANLVVGVEYVWYERHRSVVYGMTIRNAGPTPIPHLTNLRSTDVTFSPLQPIGAPTVHTI